ncbi:MAG: hypothetical protein WAV95_19860 [Azonexus sp.]
MKNKAIRKDFELAPPGAGLPALERGLAWTVLQGMRALLGKPRLSCWLRHETARSIALAASLPPDLARQRVLLPRLTGLEDDSRYWSANMVLQHLVIVNGGIRQLSEMLAKNEVFGREVRIADVKPAADAGPEQQALLRAAVDDYLALIDSLGELRSTGRHRHPWFGPLDLRGWQALSALHATAHRRQIQQIVELLQPGR